MENGCIKCGDCCEFIAAGFTVDEVRANPDFPDRAFILKHWRPGKPPEKKLNPLMSDKCFEGFIWYECDLFDAENRMCRDYENRANICKNYPGRNHKPKDLISKRCIFWSNKK